MHRAHLEGARNTLTGACGSETGKEREESQRNRFLLWGPRTPPHWGTLDKSIKQILGEFVQPQGDAAGALTHRIPSDVG